MRALCRTASLALLSFAVACTPLASNGEPEAAAKLKAFPGAMGFGSDATGGRGGEVRFVTTLADSGPGSFREAVTGDDPKYVLFAVGGNIHLKSNVLIGRNTTVAGQTAPGGVAFYNFDAQIIADHAPAGRLELQSNTILRHIRIRGSAYGGEGLMSLGETKDVVLDHISVAWSGDEIIAMTDGATNITVQWSTFEQPLVDWHEKGHHNYGPKLTGSGNGNISFYHNLITDARGRAPSLSFYGGGIGDVRGNLLYNCTTGLAVDHSDASASVLAEARANHAEGDPSKTVASYNLVGNFYAMGPNTKFAGDGTHARFSLQMPVGLFVKGLKDDSRPEAKVEDLISVNHRERLVMASKAFEVTGPHPADDLSPDEARQIVLARAGAWPRDSVTLETVANVVSGEGAWMVVGSYGGESGTPTRPLALPAAREPEISNLVDRDRDGMSDVWENSKGLSADENDGNATGLDKAGYPNIEVYLNELAESLIAS